MINYRKIFIFITIVVINAGKCEQSNDNWNGKWFPKEPDNANTGPKIQHLKSHLYDSKHGVKMGVSSDDCDNGMVNLTLDWDYLPYHYTCFQQPEHYTPKADVSSLLECQNIPKEYWAKHECMNTKIEYNEPIPTFGTHRPLWPRYGEYTFLPIQRWLHNLEHGAIALLYHPCVNRQELKLLKDTVKKCLYRHVISPSELLPSERPFALVAWGCRLLMSKVDVPTAVHFIRTKALKGPEQVSRDGQYSQLLIEEANIVSTQNDTNLCPNL